MPSIVSEQIDKKTVSFFAFFWAPRQGEAKKERLPGRPRLGGCAKLHFGETRRRLPGSLDASRFLDVGTVPNDVDNSLSPRLRDGWAAQSVMARLQVPCN